MLANLISSSLPGELRRQGLPKAGPRRAGATRGREMPRSTAELHCSEASPTRLGGASVTRWEPAGGQGIDATRFELTRNFCQQYTLGTRVSGVGGRLFVVHMAYARYATRSPRRAYGRPARPTKPSGSGPDR